MGGERLPTRMPYNHQKDEYYVELSITLLTSIQDNRHLRSETPKIDSLHALYPHLTLFPPRSHPEMLPVYYSRTGPSTYVSFRLHFHS